MNLLPITETANAAEVQVWRICLNRPPDQIEIFRDMLAPDELGRAERFVFPEHSRRFIVARGSLRAILSRYLSISPTEIRFTYGLHGKPQLAETHILAQPLYFNLAHSGELALLSVTGLGAVGIDVEQIRPDFSCVKIAERYFSAVEIKDLASLPLEEQSLAFFRCWTRKEAFIKAMGRGLSLPLDQFDVTLTPGEAVSLRRTAWDPDEAAQWSLCELEAGKGFAAALAVRGHGYRVHCRTFELPPLGVD